MTSKYKAIVFDLDGTLVDSLFDLGSSMNRVLQNHHYPIHPMCKYKVFVGNGMRKLVERALPPHYDLTIESYLDELLDVYGQHCLQNTKPYGSIIGLLRKLQEHQIMLAVNTNKKHDLTQKIVQTLFSDIHFAMIAGDHFDGHRKPDPSATLTFIEQHDLDPSMVLFVGDSDVDVQTAKNAGIEVCGVLWGFRTEAELRDAGADFIVSRPLDILKVLSLNNNHFIR